MALNFKYSSDVDAALDKLGAAMGETALRAAAYEGADIIRTEVVQRAPVRTGLLKSDAIVKRLEEKSDGNERQTYLVTIRTGRRAYANNARNRQKNRAGGSYRVTAAFYWRFIEFGTSKMPARPFMRPAFDSSRKTAQEAIKNKLRDRLRQFQQGAK